MSNNHTVTISGKEYLEYLELKNINDEIKIKSRGELDFWQNQLQEEKRNKTITIRLETTRQHSVFRETKDLISYDVHVHSLDSVTQTKFLKEKIVEFTSSLCFERDKLKEQVSLLEQTIKDLRLRLCENRKTINYFENISWLEKIFYKKRGFK